MLFVKADMDPRSGGSVRAVLDIARATRESGDACLLATLDSGSTEARNPEDDPVERLAFPASTPKRLGMSIQLARWLWGHVRRFDLVEVHEIFTAAALLTGLICRLRNVPLVVRPHGSLDPFDLQKHRWLKMILGPVINVLLLRRAAAICLTTETERARLVTFGRTHAAIHVIPLPVEPSPVRGSRSNFRSTHGVADDDFVVLFLSRVDYKKGLPALIDAVARVGRRGVAVRLVVCGTGEPAYLQLIEGCIDRSGLGSAVLALGFTSGQEKADALAGADVFALPSANENFGIAVVEAMHADLPLIISHNVYLADSLAAASSALVIASDVDSVEAGIEWVIAHPGESRAMAARAREYAESVFSAAAVGASERAIRRSLVVSTSRGLGQRE